MHGLKLMELRAALKHYRECPETEASCDPCRRSKESIWNAARALAFGTHAACEGQVQAFEALEEARKKIDKQAAALLETRTELRETEDRLADAEQKAESYAHNYRIAKEDNASKQALVRWGLEAGGRLEDLRHPESYEQVRRAQLTRGVACSSYEQKGTLDICKCGKGLREHRPELV